jgi:hypothetical protein
VLGVGEHLDGDDPAVDDREVEHRPRFAARRPHRTRRTVDQRALCAAGASGEGLRDRRCSPYKTGQWGSASGLIRRCRFDGDGVGSQHDVGIEHGEQSVEVAVAGGGDEGAHDLASSAPICFVWHVRTLHPPAGAAGELPCSGG